MSFTKRVKNEIDSETSSLAKFFVKYGYISDPDSKHFELNIIVPEKDALPLEIEIIKSNLDMKRGNLGDKIVFYIKKFDEIINFLNIVGAKEAVFEYLDSKVYKEIKADSNRIVNFETSNIKRQALASKEITDIINKIGIDNLPPKYQKVANARVKHAELTLTELADKIKMKKANVVYVLGKIKKIEES